MADEVVTVTTPHRFLAVGQWFDDFRPVTDDDVRRWLSPPSAGSTPV
jgi:predicted phosphoribosyltransferase